MEAKDRFHQQSEFLNAVLDTAGAMILVLDPKGRIVRFNSACEQLMGCTYPEVRGKPVWSLFPNKDDSEFLPAAFDDPGESEFPVEFEQHWELPDGRHRLILWSNRALRNRNGEVEFIVGTGWDITDRRRMEKGLMRANRAMKTLSKCNRALFRGTDEGDFLRQVCDIIVHQGGYRLAWVGYAECDEKKTVRPVAQSGYEDGFLEAISVTWADTALGQGPTGKAIRSGKPYVRRNIVIDPDGSPWREEVLQRGYTSSISLPLKADGQTFGALGIYAKEPDAFDREELRLLTVLADSLSFGVVAIRNRAQRRQAETELRQRTKDLERTVRELNCFYAISNLVEEHDVYLDKILQGTTELIPTALRYPEKACAKITVQGQSYQTSGFKDTPWKHTEELLVNFETIGTLDAVYQENIPEIQDEPYSILEKNLIKAIAQRLGKIIERAQSALVLRRSEKWASAGKLAAGVAHSVLNPLTSVKMRLFSLTDTLDLIPSQKEDFEVISEEIRRIDTIMKNFLEFSRTPKPKPRMLSPSVVVDKSIELLRHRLESGGVEVRISREKPLPPMLIDPDQLKEVLVNLLINALEALVGGGRIDIREQEDLHEKLGRVAVLEISDNGPGVPESARGKIFQPFFSTKEEGTGLGLSILSRIIEEHGGTVGLLSREGEGASFRVTLPFKEGGASWERF